MGEEVFIGIEAGLLSYRTVLFVNGYLLLQIL